LKKKLKIFSVKHNLIINPGLGASCRKGVKPLKRFCIFPYDHNFS